MALVGCAIATYLTLFQLGVLTSVWEPFFGDGSRTVLTSGISRLLPVPDAALGPDADRDPGCGVARAAGGLPGRRRAPGEALRMWPRLVTIAVGTWLMAAPAVLGYGGAAATSDRVVGPVVIAVGIVAASTITRGLRWANLVPGLWRRRAGAGPHPLGAGRQRALRRRLAQPARQLPAGRGPGRGPAGGRH